MSIYQYEIFYIFIILLDHEEFEFKYRKQTDNT